MVHQKGTRRHCTCQIIIPWENSQQFHNQKARNKANFALLVKGINSAYSCAKSGTVPGWEEGGRDLM